MSAATRKERIFHILAPRRNRQCVPLGTGFMAAAIHNRSPGAGPQAFAVPEYR